MPIYIKDSKSTAPKKEVVDKRRMTAHRPDLERHRPESAAIRLVYCPPFGFVPAEIIPRYEVHPEYHFYQVHPIHPILRISYF